MTNQAQTKTAVVTGATGGMGREIVADLSRDHHVVAIGRNVERLAELEGPGVTCVRADLTEDFDLPELDHVDVLVHAAAIAQRRSVASASRDDWEGHLSINVVAPAMLTQRLLPALNRAGGTVVFINSGAGRGGFGDNVVYAATKHALYALADGLRKSEHGIRVSTVAPGPTDTAMLQGLTDYNRDEVIAPTEIARAVRAVVDAGPTTQLTEIQVRPRVE